MSSEPFYKKYSEILKDGKELPNGVQVVIGSKGSMFFCDTIKIEKEIEDDKG